MIKKIIAVLTICLLMSSCHGVTHRATPEVTGEFTVSVLKVGQADAIILKTQNHTVLIDCGEKDDGGEITEHLQKSGTEKIDYLFITHYDKDHVGGAVEVLDNFGVGDVIVPDYQGNSDEYKAYTEKLKELRLTPTVLSDYMTFTLDDTQFSIYPPLKNYYKEGDNDYSLVISITHGKNKFLFAGDAEKERLAELPSQLDMEHTFLKMPHHGRYNKGIKAFVDSVKPQYTVITCSDKNPAEGKTVNCIKDVGSEVYFTSDGDVTAVSDGEQIKISQ